MSQVPCIYMEQEASKNGILDAMLKNSVVEV
jgi:hypothetical protein